MKSCEKEKEPARSEESVLEVLKAGALYFALVFGAGFALGPVRILWVVPRLGARMAELMETPIMLVVIIASARWIVRRLAVPSTTSSRLGMGCVALSLLLVAELTLVLWLRSMSVSEYLANRDPVAGTVYYCMLAVFTAAPLLAGQRIWPERTDELSTPIDRTVSSHGVGVSEHVGRRQQ